MSPLWIAVGAVAALAALAGLWLVVTYNRLVSLRERFKNAYAQIDVQLKRRYDLVPNLVQTVKGYMTHERDTLEAVIAARNHALAASNQAAARPTDPAAILGVAGAESMLGAALGRLMILREAYPQLKADQHSARLMEELASTENRIAFARQHYNDSVMTYNAYRQSFPPMLVAGPAGFGQAALFEIEDAAQREVVQVKFDSKASTAAPASGAT